MILQRNSRRGGSGPPYLKYLVIASVCLAFLVIVVPYMLKGKGKDTSKRLVPEKGAITKELPKMAEQTPSERPPEPVKPAGPDRFSDTAPSGPPTAAVMPNASDEQPEASNLPGGPTALPPPKAAVSPGGGPTAPQTPNEVRPSAANLADGPTALPPTKATANPAGGPTATAPKDLFPQRGSPSQGSSAPVQKKIASAEAKAGGPASWAKPVPSAKPAPSAKPNSSAEKGGNFAVQIGTTFKNRSQAEKVLKDMTAKGYRGVVHTGANGGGYFVTTSSCPEGKAYTLKEQLTIQGFSNTKVIRVAPARESAKEPASQEQAAWLEWRA